MGNTYSAELLRAKVRDELEWADIAIKSRGRLQTQLEKTISNTNSRELLLISEVEKKDLPDVRVSKIFQLKNKKWTHAGYQCQECSKVFSDEEVRANHRYTCSRINTMRKQRNTDE